MLELIWFSNQDSNIKLNLYLILFNILMNLFNLIQIETILNTKQ